MQREAEREGALESDRKQPATQRVACAETVLRSDSVLRAQRTATRAAATS